MEAIAPGNGEYQRIEESRKRAEVVKARGAIAIGLLTAARRARRAAERWRNILEVWGLFYSRWRWDRVAKNVDGVEASMSIAECPMMSRDWAL